MLVDTGLLESDGCRRTHGHIQSSAPQFGCRALMPGSVLDLPPQRARLSARRTPRASTTSRGSSHATTLWTVRCNSGT